MRLTMENRSKAGRANRSMRVTDGLDDLRLAAADLGHDSGDGVAMAGNDDGFAALHLIEQPGQVRFGLRRLNLSHIRSISTSHNEHLNNFVTNIEPLWAKELALLRTARLRVNSRQNG